MIYKIGLKDLEDPSPDRNPTLFWWIVMDSWIKLKIFSKIRINSIL
jgi:hypothetical protein